MKLHDLLAYLATTAPLDLAADWDNVGLLLGDAGGNVDRVLTCPPSRPQSSPRPSRMVPPLIVTHHPVLHSERLTTATAEGTMLLELARAGIAVYRAHTAFDNAPGGINDMIAARLQLTGTCRCESGQCNNTRSSFSRPRAISPR